MAVPGGRKSRGVAAVQCMGHRALPLFQRSLVACPVQAVPLKRRIIGMLDHFLDPAASLRPFLPESASPCARSMTCTAPSPSLISKQTGSQSRPTGRICKVPQNRYLHSTLFRYRYLNVSSASPPAVKGALQPLLFNTAAR